MFARHCLLCCLLKTRYGVSFNTRHTALRGRRSASRVRDLTTMSPNANEKPTTVTVVVPRETLANEARVALVPADVQKLLLLPRMGDDRDRFDMEVRVESNAGVLSGFSDGEYVDAGARIVRCVPEVPTSTEDFAELFADCADQHPKRQKHRVCIVTRCKKADPLRERLENASFPAQTETGGGEGCSAAAAVDTTLIGFLYSRSPNSRACMEQWEANDALQLVDLSITNLPSDHPGNAIARMSELTGGLALDDILEMERKLSTGRATDATHAKSSLAPICIAGAYGVCGRAVVQRWAELGMERDLHLLVRDADDSERFERVFGEMLASGDNYGSRGSVRLFDVKVYLAALEKKDFGDCQMSSSGPKFDPPSLIISAIRDPSSLEESPKFFTPGHFRNLPNRSIILDLSMTEGGNVWGSRSDQTLLWPFSRERLKDSADSDADSESMLRRLNYPELSFEGDGENMDGVVIHSVTGYPKKDPRRASTLYSNCMRYWVQERLAKTIGLKNSGQE